MLGIYYNNKRLTKIYMQEPTARHHTDNPSLAIVTPFELFISHLSINYIDLFLPGYLTIEKIDAVASENQSVTTSRKFLNCPREV